MSGLQGVVSDKSRLDKIETVIGPARNQLEADIDLESQKFESEQIEAEGPKLATKGGCKLPKKKSKRRMPRRKSSAKRKPQRKAPSRSVKRSKSNRVYKRRKVAGRKPVYSRRRK